MNDVFLSIKEFAKRAKVSPQAVYKRLDKDLKEYFKVIDGKKSIKIEALKQFEVQPEFKPTIQPVDNHFKPNVKPVDNQLTTSLNQTLKILSDQLFEKDKQISELNERLKEANELNRNNQILIGRQQEKTKQIEEINQTISPVKKFFWDRFRKGV